MTDRYWLVKLVTEANGEALVQAENEDDATLEGRILADWDVNWKVDHDQLDVVSVEECDEFGTPLKKAKAQ